MKIPISDENSFPNLNKLQTNYFKKSKNVENQSEKFYFSMNEHKESGS